MYSIDYSSTTTPTSCGHNSCQLGKGGCHVKSGSRKNNLDQVISIPSDIRMITQLIGIPLEFRVKKTRQVNSLGQMSYNIQPSNQMKGTAISIGSRTANFSAEEVVDIIKNWATTSPSVIQNLTQDNTEEMQSYPWGQNILLDAEYTLRLRSATRGDEMKMGISVSTECGGKVNNCDFEVVISSNKDVIRFYFLEDETVGMNFDISTARFMVMLGPGGNEDMNFSTNLKKKIINREKARIKTVGRSPYMKQLPIELREKIYDYV
jgi:hypothetical protein